MKDKQLVRYVGAILFTLLELYALRPIALWSGSFALVVILHIVFLAAAIYGGYAIFFKWRAPIARKVLMALGIFVLSYMVGAWIATYIARYTLMLRFQ